MTFRNTYTTILLFTVLVPVVGCAGMEQDAINPNGIVDEECGTTALMQAAEEGDLDEVRMLLGAGADPDLSESDFTENNCYLGFGNIKDPDTALGKAATSGHVAVVRELISAGVAPHDAVIWAIEAQQPDVLRVAVDAGAEIEEFTVFDEQCTLLTVAAMLGEAAMARALLDAGANPNTLNRPGCEAAGASDMAGTGSPYGQSANIFERMGLLSAEQLNNADDFRGTVTEIYEEYPRTGGTALMWAAALGEIEILRMLLEAGADPNLTNEDGESALDWVIEGPHEDIEELLRGITA